MKITHYVKRENSGLLRCALEYAHWEERLGHDVCLTEPSETEPMYGNNGTTDIHAIHSQLAPKTYHDNKPKIMFMHGEPLSSVANKISMKAIVDLAPLCEAFICMREEEQVIWNTIKRTYRVPKGVDLEQYKPIELPEDVKKLSGSPAVLYCENWRGERNPLYLCVAMQLVAEKYPDARLHLFNCQSPELFKTFKALADNNKWYTFLRTMDGPVDDVNQLYNRADIVVSCLSPLYARTAVESLAAGKAHIGPGYHENDYPFTCNLEPQSMADAIIKCHENYDTVNYREWAEKHHSIEESTKQVLEIYQRYL